MQICLWGYGAPISVVFLIPINLVSGAAVAWPLYSISIRKAVIKYGVPEQMLRDRCKRKIGPETVKSGPQPVLSMEQEAALVEHIQSMASVGYGYTRAEVIQLGTEYAQQLGLRGDEQPFIKHWFYNFLARWPELKVVNPKSLSEVRAKAIF